MPPKSVSFGKGSTVEQRGITRDLAALRKAALSLTMEIAGMDSAQNGADTLASRVNKLFDVFHVRNGPVVSNTSAVAAIRDKTGISLTVEVLQELREGRETGVPTVWLNAIADFFGVPAAYLTDRELDQAIDAQLDLLRVLRDKQVQDLRLCPCESLSPQAMRSLAATIAALPV